MTAKVSTPAPARSDRVLHCQDGQPPGDGLLDDESCRLRLQPCRGKTPGSKNEGPPLMVDCRPCNLFLVCVPRTMRPCFACTDADTLSSGPFISSPPPYPRAPPPTMRIGRCLRPSVGLSRARSLVRPSAPALVLLLLPLSP